MNTNGHGARGAQRAAKDVAQHVDRATEAAQALRDEAQAAGKGLAEAVDLKGRVDRHPYGMVAAALGTGYLLGGGLFTATTGRLIRLGLKLAALPMVHDELLTLAETAVDSMLDRSRKMNSQAPGVEPKE